jgi:hypothetical protein
MSSSQLIKETIVSRSIGIDGIEWQLVARALIT